MAHILIGTMPFTGHVNPGLPIAKALVERGNKVWWYTGKKFRSKIEAAGATFVGMKAGYDIDDQDLDRAYPGRNELKGLAQLKFDIKHAFIDAVPGYVEDLEAVIPDIRPDVMVVDNGFGAAGVIHARKGIPWATFGVMPLSVTSQDTAPMGLAMLPNSSPMGRFRNRALNFMFNNVLFRDVNAHTTRVMGGLGLPMHKSSVFDNNVSPFLYLQPTVEAFEYPRSDLAPQVHFIGPFLPGASQDFVPPRWWDEMVNGNRPVVHVTQGTVATETNQLIIPTINALADEDVLVVVTTGGKPVETLQMEKLPDNVRVESFIPHYHLLPHVSVMVTNGGYGGVQIALANGVPLIVAGASEDKPEVANRVAWSGTGVNLRTGTPTPEQVRDAVRAVLTSRLYKENARVMQAKLQRHQAALEASTLIEHVAQTRQPVFRNRVRSTGEMKVVPAV